VSGPLERLARRILGLPVVPTLILCFLAFCFLEPASHFRRADRTLALGLPVGLAELGVILVVLAYQIGTLRPSPRWRSRFEAIEEHAPLIIIYIVLLNVFAPFLALLAFLPTASPPMQWMVPPLAIYSSYLLYALFILAAAGLGLVARLVDRLLLRGSAVRRLVALAGKVAAVVTGAFCVWGVLLGLNGGLDTAPATERRGEIVRIWGVPGTTLWWADVRPLDTRERGMRVFMLPGIDEVVAGRATAGQQVRLTTRPGAFGLSWVASLARDRTPQLEPLVAAAPTAANPRRWLVESLLKQARWPDAVQHTEIYAGYYPLDTGFVAQVVRALRAAGQVEAAGRLEQRPAGASPPPPARP
jgi:hypothetical protein